MWNSVSRTLGYGWTVGVSLVQKMSDKLFDSKNIEEEDASIFTNKMPEDAKSFEKTKIPEHINDQKLKVKSDTVDLVNAETIHLSSIQFDSLDETSLKSNATNSGLKKTNKVNDNYNKMAFIKADNRSRQKISSDVRWNHVGNGSNETRWFNCEKLGKSQSDLSNSKWMSNAESSVKSEYSHKGHVHPLNSSESDIFPSRSVISNNPNESSNSRPHSLFKSSSSSQLPSIRGNYMQSNRQWRYGGNSTARPVSVVSMQQSYAPHSLYVSNHSSYGRNFCSCNESSSKKPNRAESILSLAEVAETPEGLSWRRLHMSRAKLKATATTSELLSGFAMVAMVELQINKPTAVPEWLFVLFAVCTTILVSVHIFALMISTYLLPNIDAVSKLHVSSLVTESPHDRMKSFIELAWAFSTILGLFLFLVEIAILCWVKFWDYSFTAAMSATMIIMPVLVLFVAFAMHFYHSLVVIKCKTSVSNMQELENMKRQLDNVSPA